MAGVKRLLLIRKKDVRASLINESGFSKFVKQDPIPVCPLYHWEESSGLSHYAYLLEGLNLADLEMLTEWEAKNTGATLLAFGKVKEGKKEREQTIEEVLSHNVSLKINSLGADKDGEKAKPEHQVKLVK